MDELPARLRAIADLTTSELREEGGRHEYDGRSADLSLSGVRDAVARLGDGAPFDDPHDEAHVCAVEEGLRYELGELELHRSNPLYHLLELDTSCYDKVYAPERARRDARLRHLAGWPAAIDAAIEALDRLSAPVATAVLAPARGLAEALTPDVPEDIREPATQAHGRLVAHLECAAAEGDPSAALGGVALARLMGTGEAADVDLGRLAERADTERDRLTERLAAAAARIDPERAPLELARSLARDHPEADAILDEAGTWTGHVIAFTRDRDLVPHHDGECVVRLSPASQRWSPAMMSWAAPAEPDSPSYYYVTPPDPAWSAAETSEWLEMFSATFLPAVSVHEVAPGHFAHGRAMRKASGIVRRTLFSAAFVEGWAHYAEELCVDEGFGDYAERATTGGRFTAAHFELGVWSEALTRVTRLASAIGVHTGAMTVDEAARRFAADTPRSGPAALAEARRATFDPTYGRYTWGKLEILGLRDRARQQWGSGFTTQRFHRALLDLGAPPLGLLPTALERG